MWASLSSRPYQEDFKKGDTVGVGPLKSVKVGRGRASPGRSDFSFEVSESWPSAGQKILNKRLPKEGHFMVLLEKLVAYSHTLKEEGNFPTKARQGREALKNYRAVLRGSPWTL